jgi:hypothetical protein
MHDQLRESVVLFDGALSAKEMPSQQLLLTGVTQSIAAVIAIASIFVAIFHSIQNFKGIGIDRKILVDLGELERGLHCLGTTGQRQMKLFIENNGVKADVKC